MRKGAPTIAEDVYCPGCGYNLRGLTPGRNCPECGQQIPLEFRVAPDPLLSGDAQQNARAMWGLTLIALCCFAAVVQRLGYSMLWAIRIPLPLEAYFSTGMLIAAAWIVGVVLATPRRLDPILLGGGSFRLFARGSQLALLAANVLWLLAETKYAFTPLYEQALWWAFACAALGWVGALALAFVLLQVAEALELDEAQRRIGLAIWTLPVLTAVITFIPLQAYFFVLALMLPLLLAWGWYLIGFARGVWELRQHVAWALRSGSEASDREARIAETKAALDREVAMQVRSLPPAPHAPPTTPQPMPARRSRRWGA
jgi:hypothetical protein